MKKSYLIGIVIIIVIAIIFYFIGYSSGKNSLGATINQYKKVIDYYTMTPEEVFSVTGNITEIKDKLLSIEFVAQDPYKLPEEWKKEIIKVVVSEETKIFRPDADRLDVVSATFSDLKVGIRISATSNENIKNKTGFTAKSIMLIE